MLTTSKVKGLTFVVTTVLLVSSCVSKKSFNALTAEKESLAKEMKMMRSDFDAKITALEEGNKSLETKNTELNGSIGELNTQLSTTQSKVDMVEKDLSASNAKISAFQMELNAAFADINNIVSTNDQRIKEVENMLYLDLDDPVIYTSGSTNLTKSDIQVLDSLASVLKANPNLSMIVEGHTDSKSISNGKFSDNWDLSVGRSTKVVRKLIELGVEPSQLIAAGRGQYMPIKEGTTAEELKENRRIEFMVVPNVGKLYKVSKQK